MSRNNLVPWFIVGLVIVGFFAVLSSCEVEEAPEPTVAPPTTPYVLPTVGDPYSWDTPVPTVTPTPLGTGIVRAGVQELFGESGMLAFYDGGWAMDDDDNFIDYWIGESFAPEVRLELYGPARDLTKLEMGLWAPIDDKEAVYLFALLTYVFPNEGDRPLDWLVENLVSALDGDKPSKRYGDVTITMSRLFESYLVVTVTGVN